MRSCAQRKGLDQKRSSDFNLDRGGRVGLHECKSLKVASSWEGGTASAKAVERLLDRSFESHDGSLSAEGNHLKQEIRTKKATACAEELRFELSL